MCVYNYIASLKGFTLYIYICMYFDLLHSVLVVFRCLIQCGRVHGTMTYLT